MVYKPKRDYGLPEIDLSAVECRDYQLRDWLNHLNAVVKILADKDWDEDFEEMAGKFRTMQASIHDMETLADNVKTNVGHKQTALEAQINEVNDRLSGVIERINNLEQNILPQVSSLAESIQDLNNRLHQEITDLSGQITDLSSRIKEYELKTHVIEIDDIVGTATQIKNTVGSSNVNAVNIEGTSIYTDVDLSNAVLTGVVKKHISAKSTNDTHDNTFRSLGTSAFFDIVVDNASVTDLYKYKKEYDEHLAIYHTEANFIQTDVFSIPIGDVKKGKEIMLYVSNGDDPDVIYVNATIPANSTLPPKITINFSLTNLRLQGVEIKEK